MPLYEYHCATCGHDFEQLVRNDRPPICPACRGEQLEKRLSVFAVNTHGASSAAPSFGPCGTCGDPRGPGSCSMN